MLKMRRTGGYCSFKELLIGLSGLLALMVAGCGGGGGGGGSDTGSGAVTTHLSDPAQECAAPLGDYSQVWVTVKDVTAHSSSSGQTVDLTPNLTNGNKAIQVNLLDEPNTECFLSQLGAVTGLPPGTYDQIRVMLLANGDNSATVVDSAGNSSDACSSANPEKQTAPIWNCLVQSSTPGTACTSSADCFAMKLPSEAQTGIKIPPGQLSQGPLVISQGEGLDLDIDFNACASVVQAGKSGNINLKPTLRMSELGVNPLLGGSVFLSSVNGTAVATPGASPVMVPDAHVWLEQEPSAANYTVGTPTADPTPTPSVFTNQIVQTTATDSNGQFGFCPIPVGTYDIVADSEDLPNSAGASAATITRGVTVSNSSGVSGLMIPLVPQPTPTATPAGPATIAGEFTTTSSPSASPTPPGTGDDITFNALQQIPSSSPAVQAVIPVFSGTVPSGTVPPVVTTVSSPVNCGTFSISTTCPTGTNCECFGAEVPSANPVVGAASVDGSGYTQPDAASTPIPYSISGAATVIGGTTQECSPSMLVTDPASPINVPAGQEATTNASIPTLSFQGCD
jgi:Domain of unknown function (DUF4382)